MKPGMDWDVQDPIECFGQSLGVFNFGVNHSRK